MNLVSYSHNSSSLHVLVSLENVVSELWVFLCAYALEFGYVCPFAFIFIIL